MFTRRHPHAREEHVDLQRLRFTAVDRHAQLGRQFLRRCEERRAIDLDFLLVLGIAQKFYIALQTNRGAVRHHRLLRKIHVLRAQKIVFGHLSQSRHRPETRQLAGVTKNARIGQLAIEDHRHGHASVDHDLTPDSDRLHAKRECVAGARERTHRHVHLVHDVDVGRRERATVQNGVSAAQRDHDPRVRSDFLLDADRQLDGVKRAAVDPDRLLEKSAGKNCRRFSGQHRVSKRRPLDDVDVALLDVVAYAEQRGQRIGEIEFEAVKSDDGGVVRERRRIDATEQTTILCLR